jgi:hypothetical protein
MLGPKPSHSADEPSRTLPLTSKSVAVAATEMLWAVALATTRASIASTTHGLALWSRMMRVPVGPWSLMGSPPACRPMPPPAAATSSTEAAAASGASAEATASHAVTAAAADGDAGAFASYRSSGGHAAAQVITHH